MLQGRVWVLDGGLASTLEQGGISVDGDPLWSARLLYTDPDAIKKVHASFLDSGAQIITTSSYQASIPGFRQHLGITEEAAVDLITLSVALAREAVSEHVANCGTDGAHQFLVAGSVGPYGACQADGSEYSGQYVNNLSTTDLIDWHRPRVAALVGAGVDVLAIETIPAAKEALAILELLAEFPSIKAWVTFSCKDGHHTNYGDRFSEAVKKCYEKGSDQLIAVGVNCSPPQHLSSLLREANASLPSPEVLPRVVYPNSGEEWVAGKGWEGRGSQWSYVDQVVEWRKLGASIIGGCCRLGPSDIKAIASVMSSCV